MTRASRPSGARGFSTAASECTAGPHRLRSVRPVGGARSLAVTLLALLAAPACSRPRPRPNVLLITVDTLRADRLGCYGYASAETPAIDRLAREGTLFQRAYSPLPLTLPAHATILTGLEPPSHGLVDNGQWTRDLGAPTLAERLHAQGFETAGFVAAFVLNRAFGLGRGFTHYDDGPPDEADVEGLFRRGAPGAERVDALLAWLSHPRAVPFFAWLHVYDVHAPHVAPEPFARRYAARPYDGEVAYVDSQLRRVLDFLDARGLTQQTLVVLTADHGEGLGEHGEETHGIFVYDSTLHVPLILRWPGVLDAGRIEPRVAALADVTPTLMSLVGLPVDESLHGRALFTPSSSERVLWAQSDYPRRHYGWAALRAVRRGQFKYVRAPRAELFDLAADPGEVHDLSATRPDLVRELDGVLGLTEQGLQRARTVVNEPDAEQRARLAALGYVAVAPTASSTAIDPKDGLPSLAGLETAFDAPDERDVEGWSRAAVRLEELSRRYPLNGHLSLGLGRALERLNRPAEAAVAYRRAAAQEDSRLMAYARLVALARERGDAKQELADATSMAAAFPQLAAAQRRLGEASARAGRTSEARSALQLALQLDPDSLRARLAMGRFLLEHAALDEARNWSARLARELPDDVEVQALQADVSRRQR